MQTNKKLRAKLEEIQQIIIQHHEKEENTGVLVGLSGLALFQFYYAQFLDKDEPAELGLEMLSSCIDKINNGYTFPTYCTGLSGMGWVLDHLSSVGMMEDDNDELLTELDEFFYGIMRSDMGDGNYDFLHGAIGYGYYFLGRFEQTPSAELKKAYAEKINFLIDQLEARAEVEGTAVKWLSTINLKGLKGYNFSLSHGMSSIINFFSRLYVHPEFRERVAFMLRGGIEYIQAFRFEDDAPNLFPAWVLPGTRTNGRNRVAWCYGDLGVAVSFWQAAQALNDQDLAEKAVHILKHTARRRAVEDTAVMDASICHGSYGNAQLFNRMYRETGEEAFKEAALFWIEDGLERAIHDDGYAGYKQWREEDGWTNELSLLEGVAGIGLTIIDYLSEEKLSWDECLMIS